MFSEIGSDFFDYSYDEHRTTEFWWEDFQYNVCYLKSGRNAIKAFCQSIRDGKKSVLIPIYTCETVIKPFIDEGWEINYYLVNRDLSIDEASLSQNYRCKQPSVVFVQTYFGFNTVGNSKCILECQNNGAIIVEDLTQSLFSNHHIERADYYVTSFRKFFAIPDGGALISNNRFDLNISEANKQIVSVALEAYNLKRKYFQSGIASEKVVFREKYAELHSLIAENEQIQSISALSDDIIHGCDQGTIKSLRRINYRVIDEFCTQLEMICPVMPSLTDGCTPLYYPIYVNNRRELQNYLSSKNIFCPVIWPKPAVLNDIDENTKYMYEHMLCIPIDQRYSYEDMKRIGLTLKEYYQK